MATVKREEDRTLVKSPEHFKTKEIELGNFFRDMVDLMGRIYKNQVIHDLDQKTIDKFQDAQSGNYAVVLQRIASRIERKLRNRFSDKRIKDSVQDVLKQVDKDSKKKFYARMSKALGIPTENLVKNDGMVETTNALILETKQWATRLRDKALENFTANTLRAMMLGSTLDQVVSNFDGVLHKERENSKFLARNQVVNFNSISNKIRAQKLGITNAIWRTAEDERVRPCHRVRNGKEFSLKVGLFSSCDGLTLLPGIDFNCRCDYLFVIPDDDKNIEGAR